MEIITVWQKRKENTICCELNLSEDHTGKYFWAICFCGKKILLPFRKPYLVPFILTQCIPMLHHPYRGGLGGQYYCPRNLRTLCA